MSWIKFHDELTQGAKRGLPRAARFVYLELCLLARKGRGVVVLPVGMRDVDAVCDVLGGDRAEIRKALTLLSLRSSPEVEPMIRIEDTPAGRALVIVAWEKWNKIDDSAARVARYRERRNESVTEDVTRYTSVGNEEPSLPALPDREIEKEREKTHTHRAGAGERAHAREGGDEVPASPTAAALLAELGKHPTLASVATREFAELLDGRSIASGKRADWVAAAIGKAAADTPPGQTAEAVRRRVRAYADRASADDVRVSARPAPRAVSGAAVQPSDTSWHPAEGLEEWHRQNNIRLAELAKDAPL